MTKKIKNKKLKLGGGLLPTPKDGRDFSLGGVFGVIDIKTVPNSDFMVATPLEIKDQRDLDFCTGYSLAAVSEDQEGVALDPAFVFAMIKRERGEWQSWGADLRSGCKVATKVGFIAKGDNPEDYSGKSRNFLANWNNWNNLDDLLKIATKHVKQSYFKVDGSYDTFDNFRAALWQHRAEKRSIYTGCVWRSNWTYAKGGIIPKTAGTASVGHAFKICGQKNINGELHLVVQNSYGTDVGDGGLFYFPRSVVNRDFNFGGYIFKDMPTEIAKDLNAQYANELKTLKNPFRAFWEALRGWF